MSSAFVLFLLARPYTVLCTCQKKEKKQKGDIYMYEIMCVK